MTQPLDRTTSPAMADAIERCASPARARADKPIQFVLAMAFRGELVPPDSEVPRTRIQENHSA